MSDSTTNRFVGSVADATARAAFTPSPPSPASGPAQGYTLYQRDTDTLYSWDSGSASWVAPTVGTVNLTTGVTGVLPVANGGTGVSASFVPMLKTTVTLTDAQLKALPTTAITLLAALGAGIKTRVMGVSLSGNFTAGAYTNINATYAAFTISAVDRNGRWVAAPIINDTSTTPDMVNATTFFGNAATRECDLPVPDLEIASGAYVVDFMVNGTAAELVNVPLVITLDNNGSGNLTGGNVANSMKVSLYYVAQS